MWEFEHQSNSPTDIDYNNEKTFPRLVMVSPDNKRSTDRVAKNWTDLGYKEYGGFLARR